MPTGFVMTPAKNACRFLLLACTALLLAGCDLLVLNPPGDIARQQGQLIVTSTLLMLLIIVPVIALTLLFAWRYRASNRAATYKPDWDHSTQLELVIWAAPLIIIIALGAITWITTHTLDPYRPLDRIKPGQPVTAEMQPLVIEAVSLDWKWLFFYPEQGIATVNEIAAPIDRPVLFKLTSATVMNAFYVPAFAGMIYTMAGMETQLNGVINEVGTYDGFSSHYSGAGFSKMRFRFHIVSDNDFDGWVARVKASDQTLTRDEYIELAKPSEREPARYYGSADADLYHAILNMCVTPGTLCMDKMMMIDAGHLPRPQQAGHGAGDHDDGAHHDSVEHAEHHDGMQHREHQH